MANHPNATFATKTTNPRPVESLCMACVNRSFDMQQLVLEWPEGVPGGFKQTVANLDPKADEIPAPSCESYLYYMHKVPELSGIVNTRILKPVPKS